MKHILWLFDHNFGHLYRQLLLLFPIAIITKQIFHSGGQKLVSQINGNIKFCHPNTGIR